MGDSPPDKPVPLPLGEYAGDSVPVGEYAGDSLPVPDGEYAGESLPLGEYAGESLPDGEYIGDSSPADGEYPALATDGEYMAEDPALLLLDSEGKYWGLPLAYEGE